MMLQAYQTALLGRVDHKKFPKKFSEFWKPAHTHQPVRVNTEEESIAAIYRMFGKPDF